MPTRRPDEDVTILLDRWRKGADGAEDALLDRVHRELRQLAASYLRREKPGHTLQPTAVVHEAYLRLLPQRPVQWANRSHFFGIAAQMMRRVLVDHARKKRAKRREGMAAATGSLSRVAAPHADIDDVDVLDLHDALSELAALGPRQADIVEKRYFGGMTVEEIGEVLDLSPATIKREWTTAKLWLKRRLRGAAP